MYTSVRISGKMNNSIARQRRRRGHQNVVVLTLVNSLRFLVLFSSANAVNPWVRRRLQWFCDSHYMSRDSYQWNRIMISEKQLHESRHLHRPLRRRTPKTVVRLDDEGGM